MELDSWCQGEHDVLEARKEPYKLDRSKYDLALLGINNHTSHAILGLEILLSVAIYTVTHL